jgi:hypothetical protein
MSVSARRVWAPRGSVELVAGLSSNGFSSWLGLPSWRKCTELNSFGDDDGRIQVGKTIAFGKQGGLPSAHIISDGNIVGDNPLVRRRLFDIELGLYVSRVLGKLCFPVGESECNRFGRPCPRCNPVTKGPDFAFGFIGGEGERRRSNASLLFLIDCSAAHCREEVVEIKDFTYTVHGSGQTFGDLARPARGSGAI